MSINRLCKIFMILTIFIVQAFFVFNVSAKDKAKKNVDEKSDRYFEDRFEIEIPALPTKYSDLIINLNDVNVDIEDGKLIIYNLVPDQVYNNVEISFIDNLGRNYELKLDNVITTLPSKNDNKFVYDAYKNGLGRKPDHEGFKFWYKELKSLKLTSFDFIMEMINSKEFNDIYKTVKGKIEALYRTIVGRDGDEEGILFWINEFNIEKENTEESDKDVIIGLVRRMLFEGEFKDIVKKAGFLYI